MTCTDVRLELATYRNLKKENPVRAAIESHLVSCSACQAEDQRLTTVWEALEMVPTIAPSPDFRARFWEKVRQAEEAENPFWGWLTWKRWTALTAGALAAWTFGVSGPALWAAKSVAEQATHPAVQQIVSPFTEQSIADIYFKGPEHE